MEDQKLGSTINIIWILVLQTMFLLISIFYEQISKFWCMQRLWLRWCVSERKMAYWALLSLAGPCCKVSGLLRWCASFLLERPFFSFDREIDGSMWAGFTHARAIVGCSSLRGWCLMQHWLEIFHINLPLIWRDDYFCPEISGWSSTWAIFAWLFKIN